MQAKVRTLCLAFFIQIDFKKWYSVYNESIRKGLIDFGKSLKHATWAEVKKRCGLNQADIQMAKELGMKPKSLIKNVPGPKQHWKAPVKVWVRELYEEKFGEVLMPEKPVPAQSTKQPKKRPESQQYIPDEELPF